MPLSSRRVTSPLPKEADQPIPAFAVVSITRPLASWSPQGRRSPPAQPPPPMAVFRMFAHCRRRNPQKNNGED